MQKKKRGEKKMPYSFAITPFAIIYRETQFNLSQNY